MKSCKNTSKICQKSLGVSIILKIYRKTKKGLCELFRKGLFCHTQEILRELFLILCYCFLILKIEIVSRTFSPIALSNDVFIPTFYTDLLSRPFSPDSDEWFQVLAAIIFFLCDFDLLLSKAMANHCRCPIGHPRTFQPRNIHVLQFFPSFWFL